MFYKQKRLTKYGRVFEVYKFRTMKEENSIHKSVTENDDRITKVGKYLRKFRIDELPQLLNILKGEHDRGGPGRQMLENVEKYTEELPEFCLPAADEGGPDGPGPDLRQVQHLPQGQAGDGPDVYRELQHLAWTSS